jgi:hypothetical protein
MADRADVHRVGDHDLAHERFEHPGDLKRVPVLSRITLSSGSRL